MEEKVTLTKKQLEQIISMAYKAGLHEEGNYEIAMRNLGWCYVKAGIQELMPFHVRYEYDKG